MNFDDTLQEAEFRATARKWIDANAQKKYEAELSKSSLGRIRLANEEIVDVGKSWQKKKAEGGWACLHWPKEYGGRGATPIEKVIWQQEEGVYGKLTQPFQIGEGMCGPTVMAFGSEDSKRRYLPKLASGEEIWCQLFSEPAGGSDGAGLRTRAEKKGDNWIVNRQKIRTSGAHYSDYGLLVTRSKLASWAVKASGLKYTSYRAISALSKGDRPGPENSIGKLVSGMMLQDIATYAMDLQGAAGALTGDAEEEARGQFQQMLLSSPSMRIAGGTDEILRNIIAERVLGLPGDIRVDKDVPFNTIPTNGR